MGYKFLKFKKKKNPGLEYTTGKFWDTMSTKI